MKPYGSRQRCGSTPTWAADEDKNSRGRETRRARAEIAAQCNEVYMTTPVDAVLDEPGPDGEPTLADWFAAVLTALVEETEGFSGKRPLGDSGWWPAIDAALTRHGVEEVELMEEVTRRLLRKESDT